MRTIFFIFICISLNNCENAYKIYTPEEISSCMQQKINDFTQLHAINKDAKVIRFSTATGDAYLLTDGSEMWDGGNPILDNNCEIICHTCGECFQSKCLADLYNIGEDNIVKIWPK